MEDLKKSGQAVGAQVLTNLAGFAPPTILSQAARLQARQPFFNLVVTNVPGPQFPLYLLGRRLQVLYPVVPLAQRQALGIAVMSYDGHLGFGLLGDYDALPDLDGTRARPEAGPSPPSARAAGVRPAGARPSVPQAARPSAQPPTPAAATPTPEPAPGDRGSANEARQRRAEVRLALCQMNATVGDIAGNAERIRDGHRAAAADAGAELVLFPELALTGYPPEDLLLKEHFLADAAAALARARRRRRARSSPSSASPSAPTTSTTPPPCSPTAPSTPSTARSTCPTTASSTSSATSRPGPPAPSSTLGEQSASG